jgi:ABC-type amino acid transport substrate-binding protein
MKTFKTYILFFTILLIFSGYEKFESNEEKIKIGIIAPAPPFSFFEENEWSGFSFELANLISQKLNKKLEVTILETKTSSVSLKNKFIDTIIGTYPIELRKKEFIFSDVYLEQGFILIFKKGENITK